MEPLGRVALLAVSGLVVAGCGSTASHATTGTGPSALPRIHESFTLLPCPHGKTARGTTVGIEGCLEHAIVGLDTRIRTAERSGLALVGASGRRSLVRAERGWLHYRREFCTAEASGYAGGTLQPVIFAECVARANREHLAALVALMQANGNN